MNSEKVWEILGIAETTDADAIIAAYRQKVVTVNPEDDPEGFKALREAYENARFFAENGGMTETVQDAGDDVDPLFKPFVDEMIEIYDDIDRRVNLECWKELFSNPICNELDTADQAREEFLKVLLDRFYLPHNVYKYADSVFMIKNEVVSLRERFPENFIDYVCYHIENEDFIDYSKVIRRDKYNALFEEKGLTAPELPDKAAKEYEKPDYICPEDNYFRAISSLVPDIEEIIVYQNNEELAEEAPVEIRKFKDDMYGILTFIKEIEIFHPIEYSASIRLLEFYGENEKAECLAEQVVTGKTDEIADLYLKATACYYLTKHLRDREGSEKYQYLPQIKNMIDDVLRERPKYNIAVRAKIYYFCALGDYEKANDTLMSLFEMDANSAEAIALLPYINDKLVSYYDKKIEEEPGNVKHVIDKCWGLFRCDKVDETIELLKSIDIPEPFSLNYSDYYNLLGRCYSKKDDLISALPYLEKWREALLYFDSKRKKDPESLSEEESKKLKRLAYCYYLCGVSRQKNEELDKAEEYIRFAIENEPCEVDIPFYQESLGLIYHENHEYAKAMETWNQMIEQNKYNIAAYVRRQATAFEMHDAQLVIDDYYYLLQQAPNYIKNYYYAAKVFYIYDQLNSVEEVFAKAKEENIDSECLMLIRGDMYLDEGDLPKATEIFDEIIRRRKAGETDLERFDALKDFYLSYGRCLRMNGKSADECYREGLQLEPNSIGLNYAMGVLKYEKDQYSEAIEYLEKTLELNPEHRAAHNKLSRVYDELYYETENPENYKKAVEHAVKQLENDNDDYYYVESALLYNKGAEYEKSVIDCEKALEKDDTNFYAYNAKGVAHMMLKEYEKAEECFERGLKAMENADPQDALPNLYHNLAKCYEMQFKYSESVRVLKEIIQRFGENKSVHYRLALASKKAGFFDEAVNEYMKVAGINENSFRKSGNEWDLLGLFESYIDIYNTRLSEHNKFAMEATFKNLIKKFIDQYKLLDLGGKNAVRFENKNLAAYILERYSSMMLYSMREYKKALKIAERALSYLGPIRQIKDRNLIIVYMDISATVMVSAAYIGKIDRARDAAREIQECVKTISKGRTEDYLNYTENPPYRKKEYALTLYFLGDKKGALDMLSEVLSAVRCRACRHAECYEAYLMKAKICEFEHDIQGALEYYRKAAVTGADDSEVVSALNLLTGGKN